MTRQSRSNTKRRTSAEYREDQRARRAEAIARKRARENFSADVDDDFYEEDED